MNSGGGDPPPEIFSRPPNPLLESRALRSVGATGRKIAKVCNIFRYLRAVYDNELRNPDDLEELMGFYNRTVWRQTCMNFWLRASDVVLFAENHKQ